MIACDLCRAELERADEQNLVLWTLYKKIGFKATLLVEGLPTAEKTIRHLCQKCRFKIVEQLVTKPLSAPPQQKQTKNDAN